MAINIASYTRPGIYITEIITPFTQIPSQTALINLVVGFSRKGPYNLPVLVSTPQQFITIFGDVDRVMEARGCFFNRTVLNILQNGPVWALSVLTIDETLDVIDTQSISVASNVANGVIREVPYDAFFDKADFWVRDTDSFLTYINSNLSDDRLLMHITNLSNKPVSVFIWKADVAGYTDTLDIYYGGVSNVPPYVSPKDQANDYNVSVLIVQGIWNDYATLSVDSRWGKYFNNSGLITSQINNFKNDNAVTVLAFYQVVSIIPYFIDINKNNIFIQDVINADTDTHGIFMAYDIDKVTSTYYRTGLLDLIGSNLVDDETGTIDYLSYSEVITESVLYTQTVINRAGNSFGCNINYETEKFGSAGFYKIIGSGSTEVVLTGITSYNLNDFNVKINSTASTVEIPNVSIGQIRKDTLYLDDNGDLGVINGIPVSNQTQWDNVPLQSITNGLLPIGIVGVGQQATSGSSGSTLGVQFMNPINNITWGNSLSNDIYINYTGSNEVTFQFVNTSSSSPNTNYRTTILNRIFGDLQSNLKQGLSIIFDNTGKEVVITNFSFVSNGNSDNSLTITVSPSININRGNDAQIYYVNDAQQFAPEAGYISLGLRTYPPTSSTNGLGYGLASINSAIYEAFDNGSINTGDYFYIDLFSHKFGQVDFYKLAGNNYITFWYNSGDINPNRLFPNRLIKLYGTKSNNSIFTILNNGGAIGSQPGLYNTRLDIIVNETVTTETVSEGSVTVAGASPNDIRYLKIYFIGTALYVDFTSDPTLETVTGIDTTQYSLIDINIIANLGSFKETLEIESIIQSNIVLVNASRYSTLQIGDYLQASYNPATLQAGEMPRRLTRVLSKVSYAGDSTLSQITTDAPIDIISIGTDNQTFIYSLIEDFATTYQAITLNGFQVRTTSMPDGTEQQQSNILNNIAINTPIYNGLINRDKISWRYLVDCFGLGLTSNSKQQLVDLCGGRLTALGFLNMPSAKSFKNSTSPSFLNKPAKTLNTAFIASGGDPTSNPSFLYSFGQGAGQSNVAYFFPYVTINDNGRPLIMPPASFVCNTFMQKQNSNLASVQPWTICAGINNGLITGIGNVELDLTPQDISNLNQMGANPIVYQMNRGFVIYTDNTAAVSPKSSLSYIHAREVLIELENQMYQMLLTFQWNFNTPAIRAEIKASADAICTSILNQNGITNFDNVMDTSNNTPAIINAQMGVLSTYIEIVNGLSVIVNDITILPTGTIASGGFQNLGS